MRILREISRLGSVAMGVWGYLTKDDILLILSILITGLSLLYDYLKNRKE